MFLSSNSVRLGQNPRIPAGFIPYICGWISTDGPWLIIKYSDESTLAQRVGRDGILDLLITPADLSVILYDLSPSILGGVLIEPTSSKAMPWVSAPLLELWGSADESARVLAVVTTIGMRVFMSRESAATTCFELTKVFSSHPCGRAE